jgi:putative tricarboxylic transport membrane protein
VSQGDFAVFVGRPISAVCLALAAAVLAAPLLPAGRRARVATAQT